MLNAWAHENGVRLEFIRPERLVENGLIESFNGKLREECLNKEFFFTLEDARQKLEHWSRHYNEQRLHRALGRLAPMEHLRRIVGKTNGPANSENHNLAGQKTVAGQPLHPQFAMTSFLSFERAINQLAPKKYS